MSPAHRPRPPSLTVRRLLSEANIELLAFQRALREYVLTVDDAYAKQFEEFNIGLEGRYNHSLPHLHIPSPLQFWFQTCDSALSLS